MNLPRIAFATLLAALLAVLSLTACGGGDPAALIDEGYRALGSGDHAGALAKFEKALADLDPAAPRYVEAKIGEARAMVHSDASTATQDFLALAKAHAVGVEHYRSIVVDLTGVKAFAEATGVLEAGKQAHPEYANWQELLQMVGDRAKSAGDTKTLDKLRGLGYIGDE